MRRLQDVRVDKESACTHMVMAGSTSRNRLSSLWLGESRLLERFEHEKKSCGIGDDLFTTEEKPMDERSNNARERVIVLILDISHDEGENMIKRSEENAVGLKNLGQLDICPIAIEEAQGKFMCQVLHLDRGKTPQSREATAFSVKHR
ncbi:hypothetical protein PsorP6_014338 [Peronosclerospora sorghi]|uniref:Uncharacterized protein n=1 Tax=Peronosclerospora sorghi TaxID=230839 RepID=A0ACC0VIX1_9STRA|nr:hypothetical protein PsorP6_014338 [Peronosclerospora sorghi]